MEKTTFLFTGQGTQYQGMGSDLYEKNNTFKKILDKTSEYLKIDLMEICKNKEKLEKTSNAQIAIFTISYAIFKILEENKIIPACAAGFSLGEITSFAASGIINFEDTLNLIKIRGETMQRACENNPGGMCSIIGTDDETIENICNEIKTGYIIPANYNCPGQTVLSGEIKAIEEAIEKFKKLNIKAIKLNTAGAFHTKLMEYDNTELINFLKTLNYKQPKFELYSNISGNKLKITDEIKTFFIEYIPKHMSNQVKFKNEIENISKNECINFIEIGPGKVLSGFVKRTCENAKYTNIENYETLNSALECFT